MKWSISPDIMDPNEINRPIFPSLLQPTRSNIKEDKNKTRFRVQISKSECCATHINDDRRNEYFVELLTEELKYLTHVWEQAVTSKY